MKKLVMLTLAMFLIVGGGTALASFVVSSNSQIGPGTVAGHKPPSGKHSNIISGSVSATDLASASVTSGKVATGAITTSKLASGGVTTDALQDGSVTPAKLSFAPFSQTLVQQANVSVPPSTTGTRSVPCPASNPRATGGGFSFPDNVSNVAQVEGSYPTAAGDGWSVDMRNNGNAQSLSFTVYVICVH